MRLKKTMKAGKAPEITEIHCRSHKTHDHFYECLKFVPWAACDFKWRRSMFKTIDDN